MAAERTEKCAWESRWGGGWLSASQWLAERMCERAARRDGKELSDLFWRKPAWKAFFLLQVRHAASLLKAYPLERISRALRTPEGRRLFSLGAPWLPDAIETLADRPEMEEASPEPVVQEKAPEPMKRVSLLDSLRDA